MKGARCPNVCYVHLSARPLRRLPNEDCEQKHRDQMAWGHIHLAIIIMQAGGCMGGGILSATRALASLLLAVIYGCDVQAVLCLPRLRLVHGCSISRALVEVEAAAHAGLLAPRRRPTLRSES